MIETFLHGGVESILSNNTNVTPTMMDETVSTLGGKVDKKREATSPPIPDVTVMEKKTRHVTGDGASALVSDEIHDVEDVVLMTLDDSDGNPGGSGRIHMLSQPLDPNTIIRIARELRSLMLPEVNLP